MESYNIQKRILIITIILFVVKIIAWYLTNSVSILTDALEYTVNVTAGLVGLYSLSISAKPKDLNHPYGHGKVEFLSAAFEGTLMIISSFFIIYESILNLKNPHNFSRLDYGIYLVAFTAIINYFIGTYSVIKGKKIHSLILIATGKHMQSDTYATLGIIIGLILLYFTKLAWLDSLVALVFAIIIIISGYNIIRKSIAGLLDEADDKLLNKIINTLNKSRIENWIDVHNLRVIKYGGKLHLDLHLTIPYYFNINEGHNEVDKLDMAIKDKFGPDIEMFIHTDGCVDFSCQICQLTCEKRINTFQKKIEWNLENISSNNKHKI